MKEKINKFDLTAALSALDDIDIPSTSGVRPVRDYYSESIHDLKHPNTQSLIEDYYDVNDHDDMQAADEDTQKDVAAAKLAKIEKIVDLDAKTPEDVQPSYVGKVIIQCPQCMTLFYKDAADIVKSEDDPDMVNVGEICQHCGNDSGYTLVGKVAEDTDDEPTTDITPEDNAEQTPAEEQPAKATAEEAPAEEAAAEDMNLQPAAEVTGAEEATGAEETTGATEETAQEAFSAKTGNPLNEDKELDKQLDSYNDYVRYLQGEIDKINASLKTEKNENIIKSLTADLEAKQGELEAALPQPIKDNAAGVDASEMEADTTAEVAEHEKAQVEGAVKTESLTEGREARVSSVGDLFDSIEESKDINEASNDSIAKNISNIFSSDTYKKFSGDDFSEDINEDIQADNQTEINTAFETAENKIKALNKETEKYVQDNAQENESLDPSLNVEDIDPTVAGEIKENDECASEKECKEAFESLDDFDEKVFDESVSNFLREVYDNVSEYRTTGCKAKNDKLIVEGFITFSNSHTNKTSFLFTPVALRENMLYLRGTNKTFSDNPAFIIKCRIHQGNAITENLEYSYSSGNKLCESAGYKRLNEAPGLFQKLKQVPGVIGKKIGTAAKNFNKDLETSANEAEKNKTLKDIKVSMNSLLQAAKKLGVSDSDFKKFIGAAADKAEISDGQVKHEYQLDDFASAAEKEPKMVEPEAKKDEKADNGKDNINSTPNQSGNTGREQKDRETVAPKTEVTDKPANNQPGTTTDSAPATTNTQQNSSPDKSTEIEKFMNNNNITLDELKKYVDSKLSSK